ncbi:MAG: CHAD domain-containing protein [Nitrospira sp.]|nr:CHAD domain-containing protein [Nitrospira sp.]
MRRPRSPIHTAPASLGQEVVQAAATYQATVLRLIRHAMAGDGTADTIHSIRTHCRRLQALLELCDNRNRAAVMAQTVSRLSRLRALQVFRQYLMKIEAPESDITAVEAWIVGREHKLTRAQAYRKIEQAVWKQALPLITSPGLSLKHRLEVLRHEHERVLSRLIEKASEKPRRKRLHALRLALKTVRYQTEWLPGQGATKQDGLKRIKQVQALLGRYEERADFRRWGKKLNLTVQTRIERDWKRARRRARRVPEELAWLLDALAAGRLWSEGDRKGALLSLDNVRLL